MPSQPETGKVEKPAVEAKTGQLERDTAQDVSIFETKVTYRAVPNKIMKPNQPVWRVRFDLATDPSKAFGLDINGEVTLGRGLPDAPDYVDLKDFEAESMGVSRRHAMLRPTGTTIYVIDLNSTNGTFRNGHFIGVKTPYALSNGDTLTLGRLQFVVRIIQRPKGHTSQLLEKADLADALTLTAKAITSQLHLDEVLNQVADTAMSLLNAGEIGVWLVDPKSTELFLEAERGIEDETVKHLRIPVSGDSPAAKVVKTGESVRASRRPGENQIKVKTDYLVESLIFVPISLAGETIGVLSATHREAGKPFTARDEKVLESIADFAAIAVQNSRTYQYTDQALARRVKELAALNELSYAVSSSLDLKKVHKILMAQIEKHWKVEGAGLWLFDEKDPRKLKLYGNREKEKPVRIESGKGIIGKVAEKGKPVIVKDVSKALAYDKETDTIGDITVKNMACVPLIVAEEPVGVLALFNKEEDESFNDQDIERLSAFANPVATAIENARLFSESEHTRAIVVATANSVSQPLLILDDSGEVIISNNAAKSLLKTNMADVFEGISTGVGQTIETEIGDQTYITTTQHSPELGTFVVMQDITYVKRLEKARTEFIQALSHDIKSPLTSIKGWGHLLQAYGELNEQDSKFVSQIQTAADRVLQMVTQLLDIALLEEKPETAEADCHLSKLVKNAVEDLEGAALAKKIKIELKESGTPYKIKGDSTHLYRSILNLIDNAIKYSPEETQVSVALTFWGETITIQVRDDGPGIPEKDLPYVFDRFYRGEAEEGKEGGVGLGLATVKTIVEAHSGLVSAQNIPNHGAEFTITLPAASGTKELKPPKDDE